MAGHIHLAAKIGNSRIVGKIKKRIFATSKNDNMYNKKFMEEAIRLANECFETGTGGPFGAVVVLGAIYWARPSRIYYGAPCEVAADAGFDDIYIYEQLGKPISEYDITAEQHDADLAAPTFERWKEFEGRVEY